MSIISRRFPAAGTPGVTYPRRHMRGNYQLSDAIAVSGGAVSPVYTQNPLVIALLILGNVRLGQWLDNPAYRSRLPGLLRPIQTHWPMTPFRLLLNSIRPAEERPHCFVADGGHTENLGVEALLVRRCRLIVAIDSGQDEQYLFSDLCRLIRWARVNHGIRVTVADGEKALDFTELTPCKESGLAGKHFLVARIHYPEPDAGPAYLVYLKSTLTAADPVELLEFQRTNPRFPHDETSDQFFEPDRFESYRQLGAHAAVLVARLFGRVDELHDPAELIDRLEASLGLKTIAPQEDVVASETDGPAESAVSVGSNGNGSGPHATKSGSDGSRTQRMLDMVRNRDAESWERLGAAHNLIEYGHSEMVLALLVKELCEAEQADAAMEILQQIGAKGLTQIVPVLHHPSPQARTRAVQVLGAILADDWKSHAAKALVAAAETETSEPVRKALLTTLAALANTPGARHAPKLQQRMLEVLHTAGYVEGSCPQPESTKPA